MTTEQALLFFTLELSRATTELGVPTPKVEIVTVSERIRGASPLAAAYIVPFSRPVTVHVMWHILAGDHGKRILRCIARHEASHIFFGHQDGSKNEEESKWHHSQVTIFMHAKWREDSRCGLSGD